MLNKSQEKRILESIINQGPVQDVYNEIDLEKYVINDASKNHIPKEVFNWLGGDQANIIDGSLESDNLPKIMVKIGKLIDEVGKNKEPIKEINGDRWSSYDLFNFNGCRIVVTNGGPGGFMFNKLDADKLLEYTK